MGQPLKIGYLSADNILDKRSWSGIHYRMFTALKKEFPDIVIIGPYRNERIKFILNKVNKWSLKLFSKRYNKEHNILRSKFYAYSIKKDLRNKDVDILFAPAGATEIAFLRTSIPICYLSDTSFGQIKNYYVEYSNFSNFSIKESNYIESRALRTSAVQVYSSEWAANYVINNYKVARNKVFVVPFGANIDFVPERKDLIKDYTTEIKILFVGVNWIRKGGDIVLDTFKILRSRGYNISLTILGCKSKIDSSDIKFEVIPFLNKNNDAEYQHWLKIYYESHLMFIPTRADCTPISFCEANAFGIPVITTDTGGVSSIIRNGENGYALSIDASAEDYADIIQDLLKNPEGLKKMSLNSRRMFEDKLNWDSWASEMKDIFKNIKALGEESYD